MIPIFEGPYRDAQAVYAAYDRWPDGAEWLWAKSDGESLDAFVVRQGRLYLLEACKCHDEWTYYELGVSHALSRPWVREEVKQLIVERFSPT